MRKDFWLLTQDGLIKVWEKYGSKVVMENLDRSLDFQLNTHNIDSLKSEIARLRPICGQLTKDEATLRERLGYVRIDR